MLAGGAGGFENELHTEETMADVEDAASQLPQRRVEHARVHGLPIAQWDWQSNALAATLDAVDPPSSIAPPLPPKRVLDQLLVA